MPSSGYHTARLEIRSIEPPGPFGSMTRNCKAIDYIKENELSDQRNFDSNVKA